MAKNKKKITTAIAAGITAAALLLSGTFAWQSINQTALNEASDVINPGGRLHDDFDGKNKDVYVENFADNPIFARVRLDEYFEIVMNKDSAAEKVEFIIGSKDADGNVTYVPHNFYDTTSKSAEYWTWLTGGSTVYVPTFNMNKDSLQADINGTYAGPDGNPDTEADAYEDYREIPSIGDSINGTEIYDADTNSADEVKDDFDNLDTYENAGNIITISDNHTSKESLGATLISIDEWFNDYDAKPGEYWVYDTDGWVYWAQSIESGTATGLLLDEIKLNQVMDDSWYYAINVVAQFVTEDDLGRGTSTGFYDLENGTAPTEKALELLEKIGVDTTAEVSDFDELLKALEEGSDVLLNGTIGSTVADGTINADNTYNFLWHNGGKMSGGTLDLSVSKYGLFINNENNWPENGDGANAATFSDITINSQNGAAVYTQAIDAPIVLKNVKINADMVGLYSEYTNLDDPALGTVTLENCTIISSNEAPAEKFWMNSAVSVAKSSPANGAGHVIINSGYYEGDYAVYVYSTGGTIEINGGYFNGKLGEDAGSLVIKGGTFTNDPSGFVAEDYEVVENEDGTFTVK